jgi:hypothetical protein
MAQKGTMASEKTQTNWNYMAHKIDNKIKLMQRISKLHEAPQTRTNSETLLFPRKRESRGWTRLPGRPLSRA